MTNSSLLSAVLKALHVEKHILTEEECRRVGEAGRWWFDELALVVAVKSCGAVQKTLEELGRFQGELWHRRATKAITG